EAHGLRFSGTSPGGTLVEVVELPQSGEHGHPWFVAVQYHPEFKSKPTAAQPLFAGFVGAAVEHRKQKAGERGARSQPPEGGAKPQAEAEASGS
ncbi:MAG: hypothetical protein AAF790_09100, partial [Planctomycetota bacterium]